MSLQSLELHDKFAGIGLNNQARLPSEIKGSEKQINVILRDGKKFDKPQIKPRQYQVELYKKALDKNVIIYLGTGLGKTFIVVMLLRSPSMHEQIASGRRVVFTAPTQDLVKQQAEYIFRQVPYKVKVYCGRTCNAGLHIDNWNKEAWDDELSKQELLCMTPAILHQALAVKALSWKSIALLILDEVHHAATSKKERMGKKSGSPYSQILKHYKHIYAGSQPETKFLGLTASLINNMPKGIDCIENGVRDLECKLGASCITDLSVIESKPMHVIWTYNKVDINTTNDTLFNLLQSYAQRYESALKVSELNRMLLLGPKTEEDKKILAYHNRLKLASSGFSIKPKSFHKVFKQLAAIRANSGLWTMSNICYNLMNALDSHSKASCLSESVKVLYKEFGNILRKILLAISDLVGSNYTGILLDYTQPKLLCLLDTLQREHTRTKSGASGKETFSCIVFVKSRVEVVAICSWLIMVSQKIEGYNFMKVNYAVGLAATMASKWSCITKRKAAEQSLMLEDFRRGKLNVLVTTSVLEEGIDLPVCSTVIRYDTSETFRVYVQSRGRSRQSESTFIEMSDETKKKDAKDRLDKYNDFEHRVKKVLSSSDLSRVRPQKNAIQNSASGDEDEDFFKDQEKGIFITPSVALTILHMYCSRLTKRTPYSDGLQFRRCFEDNLWLTTLYFPAGCPIKDCVQGKARKTHERADSSAVIAAFKALFEAGELDNHGVPIKSTDEHIDETLRRANMAPDFTPLGEHLEGELVKVGASFAHVYTWRLCNLSAPSLMQKSLRTNYKLYRINFVVRDQTLVRADTRNQFERSAFGLIVEASQDHSNLPAEIQSHYGQFIVEYTLIDQDLKIDDHRVHQSYLNYTFRLVRTFWKLQNLNKNSFADRCLFYLVPLNKSNNVDWDRLEKAFFTKNDDFREGDIVKINQYHSTRENYSQRFIINRIHHDMNPYSIIPECNTRETFKARLERQGGRIQDNRQPVVSVQPLSRSFGKTTQSRRVRLENTRPVYYLAQCLERIICDSNEAYQAYCLPELVYQIYINALVSDLGNQFQAATINMRTIVVPDVELDAQVNDEDSDHSNTAAETLSKDLGDENNQENQKDQEDQIPEIFPLNDSDASGLDSSEVDSDFSSTDSSSEDSETDTDNEEPSSARRLTDILARQEFDLQQRDRSGLEKWDLSEYNVPDLQHQNITYESSYHFPNLVDNSQRAASILSLPDKTCAHQTAIEDMLRQFQQGIIGMEDYIGDDESYNRSGLEVDLSLKPPVIFDRKPPLNMSKTMGLIEAITLRRVSGLNLEALENIGDSYFKYFISVLLIRGLDKNEGILTTARSRLVGNKYFYHLAKKNRLGCYAIMNKFDSSLLSAAFGSKPVIKNKLRMKDMADMVESIVGACLVYGSEYDAVLAMKWLGFEHIIHDDAFHEFHEFGVVFAKPKSPMIDNDNPKALELLKLSIKQVQKFQAIIKYQFNDPAYLVQAFTHASTFGRCTESYERLEFLGDAVLDFLITMTLYNAGYNRDPGQLTSSRSALVNNCAFAKLAIKYRFDIFIQHANLQLHDELSRVNENAETDPELKFLDIVDYDRIAKTLADVFEAVAGAIYLDSGCSLDRVYSIYYPMMKETIDAEIQNPTKNILSRLYEMFAGRDRVKFEFFKATVGEEKDTVESAKCTIYGFDKEFYGEGLTKRQARLRAAMNVMENLPTAEEKLKLDQLWDSFSSNNRSRPETTRIGMRGGAGRGSGRGRGRGGFQGPRGNHQSFRRF